MTLYITLQLSDGRHETAASTLDDFCGDYSLCGVDIRIRETDLDSEYSLDISADWGAILGKLMISADLGGKIVSIFDFGTDSASILRPRTGEEPFVVRNVFASKGTNGIINMAFSSAGRYYTYFDYKDGYVSAVIDLENKAIKAGEIYKLETLMIDDSVCAQVFTDSYSFNLSSKTKPRIRSGAYYCEPSLAVNICEYMNNPEDPANFRKSRVLLTEAFAEAGRNPILITNLTELLYSFYNPEARGRHRDYSVSLFRRCLRLLKECASDNILLADSDSPMAECTGFFDGIYTGNPSSSKYRDDGYDYFGCMTDVASNIARKASFHGHCFAVKGKLFGDLISKDDLTSDERKMWHLASSFNGARPYDFWEDNRISHTFLPIKGNSVRSEFHIFYNWDNEPAEYVLRTYEQSCYIDCSDKKLLKYSGTFYDFVLPPHSARGILVKQLPHRSALLYSDSDIYLGVGSVSDNYFGQSLRIYTGAAKGRIYFYMPYGSEDEVYINDELISTSRLDFDVIDGGKVFNILRKF